jgi:coenzyme F420-reducing hydrogenase alpha subunit
MSGFDPGRVRLDLALLDDVVSMTGVACERPAVARLLHGQPAGQAVALVPLIYSICGKAQGIAAGAALAAAQGRPLEARVDIEAWAEAAREHAWKLFVDWPRQLGMVPDEAFFVRLMRTQPEQRRELAMELAEHSLPASLRTAAGHGEIAQLFVRCLDARLGALGDWLVDRRGALGTVAADCLAPGIGESRVETARGTLVHRLALDGEKVADYAIVAPTDVHFAAHGDAARWLEKVRGLKRAEAERQVQLLVLAFDPCVPWELT